MEAKKAAKENNPGKSKSNVPGYIILAIVAIIAIIVGITATVLLMNGQATPFNTFKSNFNSAKRVAIYTTAYNGSQISSALGCSTAIIEEITGNPAIHRNSSTIDFFVLNQTSCVFEHGVGGIITNYTYNSTANCLSSAKGEPSIFVNYSKTNSTVINPLSLYFSGNEQFLAICGIASELG
jgi:hypothetical protein